MSIVLWEVHLNAILNFMRLNFLCASASWGFVSGFPVEDVVDTVAAGDGFAAGVISALFEGYSRV